MTGFVYRLVDVHTYATGFYDPQGVWHTDEESYSADVAALRCHWLNGGIGAWHETLKDAGDQFLLCTDDVVSLVPDDETPTAVYSPDDSSFPVVGNKKEKQAEFLAMWRFLAASGVCDDEGGMEYRRVSELYLRYDYRYGPRKFIETHCDERAAQRR